MALVALAALAALATLGEKEKLEYTRRAGACSTTAKQTPYSPGPRRKVINKIKGLDAEVLQASLSKEDEARPKATFSAEEQTSTASRATARGSGAELAEESVSEALVGGVEVGSADAMGVVAEAHKDADEDTER